MALNIKNERTVALVRELAERTGQSQTSAIENAVREALDRAPEGSGRADAGERYEAAMAIISDIHASMTDEERAAIRRAEHEMYDEHGSAAW